MGSLTLQLPDERPRKGRISRRYAQVRASRKSRHFGRDAEIQAMEGKLEYAENIPLTTN